MIGIIGAMETEVAVLKADMKNAETRRKAGMEFSRGELYGCPAVVVKSGVGKVNAAVCAQILIDDFGADCLMNTGVAGSLKAEIDIGDLVISADALHHDMNAPIFGNVLGQVPFMEVVAFPADAELVRLAAEANARANPDVRTFTGRVVSGDQFISADADKKRLAETFGGLCAEMEGAAVAHTAWLNQVPFVIIRAISDKADHSASMEFAEFEQLAIRRLVRLIREMLPAMKR